MSPPKDSSGRNREVDADIRQHQTIIRWKLKKTGIFSKMSDGSCLLCLKLSIQIRPFWLTELTGTTSCVMRAVTCHEMGAVNEKASGGYVSKNKIYELPVNLTRLLSIACRRILLLQARGTATEDSWTRVPTLIFLTEEQEPALAFQIGQLMQHFSSSMYGPRCGAAWIQPFNPRM
jgi:hypothetical protein